MLLYRIRFPPSVPATVLVWEPHGRSSDPTSLGLCRLLMSKTWRPSKSAGTGCPPQDLPVTLEFHDRTKMSSHTTMSPWLALHWLYQASWTGLAGSLMSIVRHPL